LPGGRGRPVGSRNKAPLAFDKIADDAGEDILKKMVEQAKGGDLRAADIVLSRIWSPRKGKPIALTEPLPAIKSATIVVAALGKVAELVGSGELTPNQAKGN
jgi:hypothetical protein